MNLPTRPAFDPGAIAARTLEIHSRLLMDGYRRADRLFAILLPLEWVAAVATALLIGPESWNGETRQIHVHLWLALLLGGAIVSLPTALALARPGAAYTRHFVAVGQMLMGALLIHLSGGRIEAHFHVFGSLAFLALYRDWRVLVTASLVVTVDHYIRGVFWPWSVFGVLTSSRWRWVEHAGWVIFEDVVLVYGGLQSRRELGEIARREAESEANRDLVEREVERRTADLCREIVERERVVEALRRGESTIRSFYDSAPAMMGVVELHGDDILYVSGNAATAAFFGLPAEAIAGKLASALRVSRRHRLRWIERYRESETSGRPVRFEYAYRTVEGVCCQLATVCHISGSAGAQSRYAYVLEDVTLRRRAESAQAAQHAAMRILAGERTLEEAIPRLLREVGECLSMDRGEYWSLNAETGRLEPGPAWWARSGSDFGFSEVSRQAAFSRGEGLPGQVWETGRPAWVEDVSRDPGFLRATAASAAGLRGAIAFPVSGEAGLAGVIVFFARGTVQPGDPPSEVLDTLGGQIGLFMARRRAEAELRLAHDHLELRVIERTAELDEMNAILRQSEQRFRSLADAMPQIVWTARPDGSVDYFNRRWYEFSGVPEGEVSWEPVLHPDDASRTKENWSGSVREARPFQIEYRLLEHETGAYRWHLGRALPVRDQNGQIVQWVGTCTDIDDRKRAEQLLQAAREELEDRVRERTAELRSQTQLIDMAHDAILIRSREGMITSWNQGAERMYGWSKQDAVGRVSHDLLKTRFPRPPAEIEDNLERFGSWDGELIHERKDGTTIVVASRWVLDRDGVGAKDGAVLEINSNVTDRKAAEDALRRAKDAAEAATRAKSEFLANMSHEIRTPMNGIMGMTDLALETELSPRQREYLGLVKSSADALLTVINDILDFSKIEAGKLELSPTPFLFRDVVEETARTLALRAHVKGLELACRIAPDVPDGLIGDSGRLRQILVNLLGNAIKFTEQGEIVLQAEVRAAERAGEIDIQISVADTGIGIPEEKLASIFDPFEQADNSTTRRYGGTGLGLAISGKLVGMMGGRIWAESRVGQGSTFHFTSRLRLQDEGQTAGQRRGKSSLEGARVLVVDDNATNRCILMEVLTNWGAHPLAVDGGRAALLELRRGVDLGRPFTAVVLDMMMPEMDGQELAGRVRLEPGFAEIALLLMSSDGNIDQAAASAPGGFNACLSKPLRQSELYDALAGALGTGSDAPPSPAPGPRNAAEPPRANPGIPNRRTSPSVRVLLAEDHPVNQKLAARILEVAGHQVTIAADGRKALDALIANDYDVVLMDVQMPVMDGFEALAGIRALTDPVKSRIPVIALTAHAMKGDRERCLDAGFDGYLAKPVRADALQEAIEGVSPVARAAVVGENHLIDGLVGRCGGDREFARELLSSFVETAPMSCSGIASALRTGETARLATEAHGLKGACLTIGADDLADACRRLEEAGRRNNIDAAGEESRAVLGSLAGLSAEIEAYLETHA